MNIAHFCYCVWMNVYFFLCGKPFFFDISDYFCVKCVFVAKNCHLCEIKKSKQKSKFKYVGAQTVIYKISIAMLLLLG